MSEMGFVNLWRTKLRSTLTILGVVIGIGALTSMVSFGTGMQKNVTDAFKKSDLFTSMNVTPKKLNVEEIVEGGMAGIGDILEETPEPLTDSILMKIRDIEGVEIAFPEETFPGRLVIDDNETNTNILPFPSTMRKYSPYNDLLAGDFYDSDSTSSVVIRWETLKGMGYIVEDPNLNYVLTKEDSLKGVEIVPADSFLGKKVTVITATLNKQIPKNPLGAIINPTFEPFQETQQEFIISGITRRMDEFSFDRFRSGLYIPMKTALKIPRLSFSSVWDILSKDKKEGTYSSIYVRVKRIEDMTRVREKIEALGVGVFSIADQLKEIKRGFLIMDSLLGAIGTVALIIAALGIINTMVMSILERTRDIGIMKAVGGSENEIKLIFFVEAAFIGLIGAIFGLALGWVVTRIANEIVNAYLQPADVPAIDLFYFPLWLILGAIAFSILISLAAGLYPAIRAARVDPVKALRHD